MKTNITITFLSFCLFLIYCTNTGNMETSAASMEATEGESEDVTVPEDASVLTQEEKVERGAYLVKIMGCSDCHTPKIMTENGPAFDQTRLLSGHPADEILPQVNDPSVFSDYVLFNMGSTSATGPWGSSFSANLTPDESGLGNWSFENFEKALRQGKFKGIDNGRMLLPPMPWPSYANLEDQDLEAIWAYLQSIPPIRNVVPSHIPPAI